MLRRPDSFADTDLLTDAVMALLNQSGATGFSLRSVAELRRVSVGQMTGRWGSRSRMLQVAVNTFRGRWLLQTSGRSWYDGAQGLLPYTDEDVEDCRVWAGFVELARGDSQLATCVDAHWRDEHQLLSGLVGERLDGPGLTLVQAVIGGLRQAVCAPSPLAVDSARAAMARLEQQLAITPADLGLTGPPGWFYGTG